MPYQVQQINKYNSVGININRIKMCKMYSREGNKNKLVLMA